ncbi:MAG: biopolymer transporter ExbD [Zoogloeaceae bacterium]|jgi:biopolymer transport protein ExbD|nr:biopolymer transporter ExbD [Zoogloeaceae bacterium]
MNFSRVRSEEPEINLIPLIDVMLVVIIFLMLTTTYSRFAGLEINLPSADAEQQQTAEPNEVEVAVTASGQVLVNKQPLKSNDVHFISEALQAAANGQTDPVVVISADAKTTHQSVVDVMQAAQEAGYPRISFTTQTAPAASR